MEDKKVTRYFSQIKGVGRIKLKYIAKKRKFSMGELINIIKISIKTFLTFKNYFVKLSSD